MIIIIGGKRFQSHDVVDLVGDIIFPKIESFSLLKKSFSKIFENSELCLSLFFISSYIFFFLAHSTTLQNLFWTKLSIDHKNAKWMGGEAVECYQNVIGNIWKYLGSIWEWKRLLITTLIVTDYQIEISQNAYLIEMNYSETMVVTVALKLIPAVGPQPLLSE